ncbi:MAG: penicillin acylase family protein [Saprospiraceae bacterium]|nr:penicillin acylase family protein [Lewinella sp.]
MLFFAFHSTRGANLFNFHRTKVIISFCCLFLLGSQILPAQSAEELAQQVQIRRTEYGVPHILAPNLRGGAFGLAYCELEDYGERVIVPLVAARGDLAVLEGFSAIESDLINQLGYERAAATYHLLDVETREMMEGFAQGINFYLEKHPDAFPQYKGWQFTGYDIAALTTGVITETDGRRFVTQMKRRKAAQEQLQLNEAGSNAWAFAPSRTRSGHAILVRNPHLSWTAGYYEAQLTVPGLLNFYGDFRIGGVFAIIGGFNEHLGWSTTNNHPDLNEVYALQADPEQADHYLIDGLSFPLERKLVRAEFKNGNALALETRELLFTPYGPVIHREDGKIYVLKQAGDGEYRRGQQFTRMLLAKNLEEWKDAMRMQAITASNYTYADADGNIFYVWNATTPDLPLASGGDTAAVAVQKSSQIWSKIVPFDDLPQLHNPKGGYLHNENDPFHFTNLHEILQPDQFPANFPQPQLRQRSQLSLLLIDNEDKMSLEEVVARKHSMRMLVAEQLKPELIKAVRAGKPKREVRKAIDHLEAWDNTVAAESRGGVLFENWFVNYSEMMKGKEVYATPWSFDDPMGTPHGLADPAKAAAAFQASLDSLTAKYGTWDLAWGEVHRLRLGKLDLPVGGGAGGLGCFRVLWFSEDKDGKQRIRGGDGWQLAVEFSDPPRAYSVLAYGQSNDENSPHHTDQAELFVNNKMKKVAYTEEDIRQMLLEEYHPGEK